MTAPVKTQCIKNRGLRTSRLKFAQISTIPLKPGQNERGSYVQKKIFIHAIVLFRTTCK